jgi:hypothetical protein
MKTNIIGDTLPKEKRLNSYHNWLQRWKIKNAIRHLERLLVKYK